MGSGMAVYYLNRKGELVLSLFAEEPRVRRQTPYRARIFIGAHILLPVFTDGVPSCWPNAIPQAP
jgi:hypothetical protein